MLRENLITSSMFQSYHAFFWMLCILFASLSQIYAQDPIVTQSNDTTTTSPDRQFVLAVAHSGSDAPYNINPLTGAAGLDLDTRDFRQFRIQGNLVLSTDPKAIGRLQSGDIAFISCDPDVYPGPIKAGQTVTYAAGKDLGAIVLYSLNFSRCAFTPSADFSFAYVYTTTMATSSLDLQRFLNEHAPSTGSTTITLASRAGNGTSNDSPFTKSPTTAVAMIILYSITGIITALFLVIIVVGAVRAHRHPERYGPRHVLGRPRQSRARGIARAMLETLPIVKFGDKDEVKPEAPARDIELGPAGGRGPGRSSMAEDSAPKDQSQDDTADGPELVKTETAAGMSRPKGESDQGAHTDNGLACSVCTDDFIKGQDIRVLPCKHKFHPECIDPWLLNVSGTCPLCRVDLRPTTSHPTDPDAPDDPSSPHHRPDIFDLVSAPPPITSSSSRNNMRRSRTGLSLYLQNTLNSRHMRDATPEERIAALRHLRSANRSTTTAPPLDSEPRSRNRLSARLSRAWGPSSRPPSVVPSANAAPTSDPAEPPRHEEMRRTEEELR